jgi:AmmeMemoRadiSam system protein B
MPDGARIRHSVIAGSWYPGTREVLEATLSQYLANVKPLERGEEIVGIIAPHAGYVYSGQVAAFAYRQLLGRSYDKIVVISPVHRMSIGRYAVFDADYYETPLGLVEVDKGLVEKLSDRIMLRRVAHDNEHSLEIQLPFLQYTVGEFKLLPIMMGDQSLDACRALALALAGILDTAQTLFVASTDLSHFHSYSTAVELDRIVRDHIAAFDPEGLAESLAKGNCEACGGGPVVAVMLAAQRMRANRAAVLRYANSGDVTGDRSQVVGHLAAVLYRDAD